MANSSLTDIYEWLARTDGPTLHDLVETKRNELGISSDLLAKIVGINRITLDRLLKGDTQKADLFSLLKLDEFLQIGIEQIVGVYMSSLSPESAKELQQAKVASYIVKYFDLSGLKKAGVIDTVSDFEQIETQITHFFKLESIFEYDREIGDVLFCRTKSKFDDKMRDFWVRSAIHQFKHYDNPNDYNRDALMSLIPKIRPYTRYEEKGLFTVIQALYNVGVTVIVQSYLSRTQVRGGTFAVNGKPCVVVTDFNKSYATLWFALMHELFHVCYDFEDLKNGLVYHLTGESDIFLFREDDADYFAREILFRQETLDYIKHSISSPAIVAAYAEKYRVHPAIIYAFYCYHEDKHNKQNHYSQYQQYFGKPDKALKMARTNPWDKDTLLDEVEAFKRKVEARTTE